MSKSLYVDIPDELYERIRKKAFDQHLSKKQIVITAIELYFGTKPSPVVTKLKDKIFEKKPKGDMPFS